MRLRSVEIDNYRAVKHLKLPLDPRLTVFHGDNAQGKTSVLNAIAVGLGAVPTLLPEVPGIGFLGTDKRRSARYVRVALETTGGTVWERHRGPVPSNRTNHPKPVGVRSLREKMEGIVSADEQGEDIDLPIVAFYGADRAAFSVPQRRSGYRESSRYAALEGALSASIDFRQFFEWFKAKEDEELRDQKRDPKAVSTELEAVRTAITSMIPGASQPRIEFGPLRFVVSLDAKSGGREELTLDQMGGGYRVVLALAADLARRMAQGNPHRAKPCACEAIVLIDEIDLHLHPAWQQRVLDDLLRTFPNTQFLVSTHSPQVLTSVEPERIVKLSRENGAVIPGYIGGIATYGAEAGDVLALVMGVPNRPKDNEFVKKLDRYRSLVADGEGESEEARSLRSELDRISPYDHAMNEADMEIRRRTVLKSLGKRL